MDVLRIYKQLPFETGAKPVGLPIDPLQWREIYDAYKSKTVSSRCASLAFRILTRLHPGERDIAYLAKAVYTHLWEPMPLWLERRLSYWHGKAISQGKTGKTRPPFTAEHKARIGAANKGRKLTDEQKARIGQGTKARWQQLKAEGHQVLGKPKSAEHKAKIGAANKGRQLSPEHKAKIAAGSRARWQREKQLSSGAS